MALETKPEVKKIPPRIEYVSEYPTGLTRRSFLMSWAGLAWATFSLASGTASIMTMRFMYPNVLFEPPLSFKAGKPEDFALGVDERFKQSKSIWIVKEQKKMYALITVCTHLGCTPNWLQNENKFKCPCHGSGFRMTGINFEGPAPRPLERAKIAIDATDGQIIVDRNKSFHYEKGEWEDKDSYIDLTL